MAEGIQRVLLLDDELSFRGSSLLTLRLARCLEQREIDTALVCTRVGPVDATRLAGIRLHRVSGYAMPIWGRVILRSLYSSLRTQPPDVIHLQESRLLPQASWLAERLHRPLVVSVGDHKEAAALNLRVISPQLRAIISVSESVQSQLPELPQLIGVEQRVILPGVAVPEESRIQPALPEGKEPVIGMAGPLEIIKGASFFLRACHRVIEAGHSIRIIIAGSGPEEHSLRQLADSLQLSRRLTFVDGGVAMNAYLSAIDIFCLPSLQQGLGVMMLEAMALGRPVIASGVGGVLSVLEDNRTGLIVPPSDSRSLADRIIELLNNPSRARELAMDGYRLIRDRFDEQRMVDEVIRLYQEVTATPAPAAVTLPISR